VLGENEINIAGMFNAREAIGGEAITVYDLDEEVSDEVLTRIEEDERIIVARYITLDGAGAVRTSL
jgi:D-3-phosphoglycerate dehydrogenase